MVRLAFLSALTALALSVTAPPASAQQMGGESLAPEVLNTPGAAEAIRDRVFSRLQMLQVMQSFRAGGVSSAAGASGNPNVVNSSLDRSSINQEMLARIPPRGGRVRPQMAESQPTFIDQSQTVVLNTAGGPVNVGNDNIVQQQVSTSTAISNGAGGAARSTASAGSDTAGHGSGHGSGHGGGRGKATGGAGATSQSATSTAVSVGGTAVATASNSNVVSRGAAPSR
jgi:hypothetical protein